MTDCVIFLSFNKLASKKKYIIFLKKIQSAFNKQKLQEKEAFENRITIIL